MEDPNELAPLDYQTLIDFEEDVPESVVNTSSKPSALEDLAEMVEINPDLAVDMFEHLNNRATTFLDQVLTYESASPDDFMSMVNGTYASTM